jgi:hypothetical protein
MRTAAAGEVLSSSSLALHRPMAEEGEGWASLVLREWARMGLTTELLTGMVLHPRAEEGR